MLVGEVRCAEPRGGSSWKLSGGRWWSSAPTKLSKKRQVRRATMPRKVRSAGESRGAGATSGRLNHQDSAGAASQRASTGDAASSAEGSSRTSAAAAATAIAGAVHIEA
jgi:hypothetical protein